MPSSQLGPRERVAALQRMADERFDVLVIGGGVTGCGTALDAASRGLSVALVEQRDFASGTSSRSSKLFHGGLRYLEQFEFGLVREAARERKLMVDTLCPHLARPVSFAIPLEKSRWQRFYLSAGTLLYDWIGGRRSLPRRRRLSLADLQRRYPGLRTTHYSGAIEYFDAQMDDARHTLTLARTAARSGACLASSVRQTDFLKQGSRVIGARVQCLESGREIEVQARQVILATGVWTDRVQSQVGGGDLRVRASKGVHLVVPRDRIDIDGGLVLRTATSVLFVIPWKQHWIIGTTDTDWNLDLAHPAASRRDVDYLLEVVNQALVHPLVHDDIQGVYAGLRPLLYGESDATSQLSREHAVSEPAAGLLTIAGGKYTTYRVMARDAVDAVARHLGREIPASCTERVPLVGAEGWHAAWNSRVAAARKAGLSLASFEHLLLRYGSAIDELLEAMAEDPLLGEPLEGAPEYLRVEIHQAVTREAALHLDDVLTRRTRISVETFDRGLAAARPAAAIMAHPLGWSAEDLEREIVHYEARVQAELESQGQPDDHTADAARMGAPDVRTGPSQRARGAKVVPLTR
ncbi:MAG: glycerol-3-phosphate dehydrogenase/oxidase [Myxococcota bacterium]